MRTATSFEVFRWRPAAALPSPPPPVATFDAAADVSAVILNGGATCYVPSNPRLPTAGWVEIPRLREFYGLPDVDQRAHRTRWVERLTRADTGMGRPQLDALSMPALRLTLARAAPRTFPVREVRRGRPATDRGGIVNGVTVPLARLPVVEPDCYLAVIAEAEGKLESINAWDVGAGISLGPVQFNVQPSPGAGEGGALFQLLWNLYVRDRALFVQEFGEPLGWSMRFQPTGISPQASDYFDLRIGAGTPNEIVLHGRGTEADVERNSRYFQSGVPGGRGFDPTFRRNVTAHFRNVVVWPHVQEMILETSVWWLGPGLRRIHTAGIPPLDSRNPDEATFVLKALLLSAFVRFSGCLDPILRGLRPWRTPAERLAHWRDAVQAARVPCPELVARLESQEREARRVHGALHQLTGVAGQSR
jgi:hypothetical protein